MPREYFSERELGPRPRNMVEISSTVWSGFIALIDGLIAKGSFGIDYPVTCPDGHGPVGTDRRAFSLAAGAEVPAVEWPLESDPCPDTPDILDFLEFCHCHVAEPIQGSYHKFFDHHHLSFDRSQGQGRFREAVNRILSRNNLAYKMGDDGRIVRLAGPVLHTTLTTQVFGSGDPTLDAMLEMARSKFLNPKESVRREAIEKLWDAWERVKTLNASDKKESMNALLDSASPEPHFREVLKQEARILTQIGNEFHIRHFETNTTPIEHGDHVDYLFHRLFALIWLLLRSKSEMGCP